MDEAASTAAWRIVGNPYNISPWRLVNLEFLRAFRPDLPANSGIYAPNEAWDDYMQERRDLLQFLVDRRSISRRRVAEAVWPDLDAIAAADNLRVNLNHLQRVLQPDRLPEEAPWFIRAADDRLVLHPSAELRVDADDFVGVEVHAHLGIGVVEGFELFGVVEALVDQHGRQGDADGRGLRKVRVALSEIALIV